MSDIYQTLKVLESSYPSITAYLMDCLPGHVFIIDKSGYLLWGNQAILDALNLQNLADYIGTHISHWNECSWRCCLEVFELGKAQANEESYNNKHYIVRREPIFSKGEIVAILNASIDITEQKQLETAKAQFHHSVTSLAHDIRTPYCGIIGLLDLMYQEEQDTEKKQNLAYILASAERALAFADTVLDSAHTQATALHYSEFDIHELANEVLSLLKPESIRKNIAITLDCTVRTVRSDRFRLYTVLLNLISNALKFTESGFVHVSIRRESCLEIQVEDTGLGIPEDKTPYIFEKFYKIVPAYQSNNAKAGIGLGLHVVQQFVQELFGTITIHSTVGVGTVFTVRLPLRSAADIVESAILAN